MVSDGGWMAEFSLPLPNSAAASSEIVLHSVPDDEGGLMRGVGVQVDQRMRWIRLVKLRVHYPYNSEHIA